MLAESPRLGARLAGSLYLLSVLTAVMAEAFVRGRWLYAAGLVPVSCFAVVMLLLYDLLRPASRSLALVGTALGLAGLAFEALELQPRGVNVALVLHGLYCVLVGILVFRSPFLPRILGALMAFGGLGWLTSLSPQFARALHPYNVGAGFLGEGSLMLWLLVMSVHVPPASHVSHPRGQEAEAPARMS